jgi:hypothetical protein
MKSALHAGGSASLAVFGASPGAGVDQEEAEPGDEGESADEPPADDGNGSSAGDESGDEAEEGEEGAEAGDESGEGEEGAEGGDGPARTKKLQAMRKLATRKLPRMRRLPRTKRPLAIPLRTSRNSILATSLSRSTRIWKSAKPSPGMRKARSSFRIRGAAIR